jgi:hypothetical protein
MNVLKEVQVFFSELEEKKNPRSFRNNLGF